jgi:hypothetical protein
LGFGTRGQPEGAPGLDKERGIHVSSSGEELRKKTTSLWYDFFQGAGARITIAGEVQEQLLLVSALYDTTYSRAEAKS